jgi:hypothetical protein
MLLYVVAMSLRVRGQGDSSQDGSERSLSSPENECSIGFQPVAPSDVFQHAPLCIKIRVSTLGETLGTHFPCRSALKRTHYGVRSGERKSPLRAIE